MSRDWRFFLHDILQSCDRIGRYCQGMTRERLLADERTYDAVVRNLEVIGEAAKHLPDEVRAHIPQIEWRKVAGMRDWLAHAYFGIDEDILWDVVENKIPKLKLAVQAYQDSESAGEENAQS